MNNSSTKMINKYTLPLVIFGIGTVVAAVVALIGGIFFHRVNYGMMILMFIWTLLPIWYLVVWIGNLLFGSNKKANTQQTVNTQVSDDEGWE